MDVMNSINLSSLGLSFDIIAGLLLWKYGLPEVINRKGMSFLALESTDKDEIKKAKKYDALSRVGVILLILGFILQLVSNYL